MCLAREISTYRRSFWLVLTGHGGGLAERIALYPLIIWLVVVGVWCVSQEVRRKPGRARRMEVHAQT
jgi:hypothetical protein